MHLCGSRASSLHGLWLLPGKLGLDKVENLKGMNMLDRMVLFWAVPLLILATRGTRMYVVTIRRTWSGVIHVFFQQGFWSCYICNATDVASANSKWITRLALVL